MKHIVPLALACGLLLGGCGADNKESLADEAKALRGGPMPAGTWDKVADHKKAYDASHTATPIGFEAPSGANAPHGPNGG